MAEHRVLFRVRRDCREAEQCAKALSFRNVPFLQENSCSLRSHESSPGRKAYEEWRPSPRRAREDQANALDTYQPSLFRDVGASPLILGECVDVRSSTPFSPVSRRNLPAWLT